MNPIKTVEDLECEVGEVLWRGGEIVNLIKSHEFDFARERARELSSDLHTLNNAANQLADDYHTTTEDRSP